MFEAPKVRNLLDYNSDIYYYSINDGFNDVCCQEP